VVRETAGEQKTRTVPNGWQMPYDKLYAELDKRTGGRILCGDGNRVEELAAFEKKEKYIFDLTYGPEAKVADPKAQVGDPLWVELSITPKVDEKPV
jgi:hypothetical protein